MFKKIFILSMSLWLISCASTSITENWALDEQTVAYKTPLIVAITDSQQTRQIYEKHFVSELKKIDIHAKASYQLINSKQVINRETVVNAVKGTDIDAVLVTYLISADSELRHNLSPINLGYSGNAEEIMISDTLIANRGRSSSSETVILKNDLYDVRSKTLVWSVKTKTVAPESIDKVVVEVTALLINQLSADDLLK